MIDSVVFGAKIPDKNTTTDHDSWPQKNAGGMSIELVEILRY